MPTFDNRPPADSSSAGLRLIRTPAGHAIAGHVLSDNLVGCKTHFVGNRTIPCESPTCEPCEAGVPWRWHGYLAVLLDHGNETVLFETTARAAETFAAYFQRYGTTRGAYFKAQRLNNRSNGRVLIQTKPADLEKITLPKAPAVEKLLCHIWNIPEKQVEKTNNRPRPPFQNVRVDRSADELKPSPGPATGIAEACREALAAHTDRSPAPP